MQIPDDKPVTTGLVALLAVGLAVGLLAGIAAFAGVKVVGLGGEDDATSASDSGAEQTLVLPTPSPTPVETGPLVTLPPTGATEDASSEETEPEPADSSESSGEPDESDEPTQTKKAEAINLTAGVTSVDANERIPLSGTYKSGEGAILQVEHRGPGEKWSSFPVDASVTGGVFRTWVQTGLTGKRMFRVADKDAGKVSNPVTVRVN